MCCELNWIKGNLNLVTVFHGIGMNVQHLHRLETRMKHAQGVLEVHASAFPIECVFRVHVEANGEGTFSRLHSLDDRRHKLLEKGQGNLHALLQGRIHFLFQLRECGHGEREVIRKCQLVFMIT